MFQDIISERRPWLQKLVAGSARIGLPLLPRRTSETAGSCAIAFRLATGETLTVAVDDENRAYIRGWLARAGAAAFIWFETADGCLVGINLAHVADAAELGRTESSPWSRDCVVLRFSDGGLQQLPKITGETIDYFQGASIGAAQHRPDCCGEIDFERLMCVTLPAAWLDEPA